MELKISILILLLTMIHHTCGQARDTRFIVKIGHFRQPFLNETINRCVGTLISQQHILTTASCVIVDPPTLIAVVIEAKTLLPEGSTTFTRTEGADGVFIHPHYIENQDQTANAAIVTIGPSVLSGMSQYAFVPRLFGVLSLSSSCDLFGWGGELLDPERHAVTVNNPQSCDTNLPQNFCSIFDSITNFTCSALLGSPLTCGDDSIVAGFVTNDGNCSVNNGRVMLNYHSVFDFRDWSEGVIGPELPERSPVNFIVTVMEFTPPSTDRTPRCFGTIITSRRALTTASCASVESPLTLAVQTRIVTGSSSSSSIFEVSEVYIHPNYRQDSSFGNNVAIIETRDTFDVRIIPRSLGGLQTNNQCQLFGWGPTNLRYTRGDAVTIHDSQSCNPNLPQAFCSSHPTVFHYSCYAMTGSPVTCGDESIISGFLINNASCISNDGHVSLSYHSVSQFLTWIDDPSSDPNSGGGVTVHVSTSVILLVIFVNNFI